MLLKSGFSCPDFLDGGSAVQKGNWGHPRNTSSRLRRSAGDKARARRSPDRARTLRHERPPEQRSRDATPAFSFPRDVTKKRFGAENKRRSRATSSSSRRCPRLKVALFPSEQSSALFGARASALLRTLPVVCNLVKGAPGLSWTVAEKWLIHPVKPGPPAEDGYPLGNMVRMAAHTFCGLVSSG